MTVDDKAREIALWNKACGLAEVFAAYFDESDDEEFRANATRDIFYALRDTERRVWEEASKVAWEVKDCHGVVSGEVVDIVREISQALRARQDKDRS